MSFKTDRLAALFPDAYAARDGGSLLRAVLDAIGAELVRGDAAIKDLLKSHWIDYARGGGIDGLGALFGVERRLLPDGTPEGDDTFRPLVKSTVPSFVGGGTVQAIRGAVRAALGLPYNLDDFAARLGGPGGTLSASAQALIDGLERLVRIEEFAPKSEVKLGATDFAGGVHDVTLDLDFTTIEPLPPRIEWSFDRAQRGGGRLLSLTRQDSGSGVKSRPHFEVPAGATLVLAGGTPAAFTASIGSSDVSAQFTAADGVSAPALPAVPSGHSTWIFRARRSAEYDAATFDAGAVFDTPEFAVRMQWLRLQPLVFDVIVPYFVDAAVQRLLAASGQQGRFKLFKGLSLDAIQRIVDRSRASGVRGMVQYAINLPSESSDATAWEDQGASEKFAVAIDGRAADIHDAVEALEIGAFDREAETQDMSERFVIGGNFNVAQFDKSFGFL